MNSILRSDFPADRLSKPEYKVKVEKDVYVEMRDGVRVCVDIYRPDAPGKFPSLYASSPYQKDYVHLPAVSTFHMRETNDIYWFVERGYAYVNADARGTGKSTEGTWKYYSQQEREDHYDLIEWIARQPWCTGKVGMIGESYYGVTQWQAAEAQPPHLATIVPFDAGADKYREGVYHGGLLSMGFVTWWHFNLRANHLFDRPGPHGPEVMSWDLVSEVLRHPLFDAFWEERAADFKKIKCPVYSIGIWHKVGLHLRGNLMAYEELEVPKKLLVCHGESVGDEMAIFNSLELRLEMLRWYDHWLKGNDTGIMDTPPVRIFVRNSEEGYRDEQDWPLKRARYRTYYLHSGPTGAVESLNDGRLAPDPPKTEKSAFIFEYPDPEWSGWSGIGTAKFVNGFPHPTIKILTFCTEPLREDLEVTGPILLVLYLSSTEKDADMYARLVDQLPDSMQQPGFLPPRGRILTRGWLKASHRDKDPVRSQTYRPYYTHKNPQPIEPGRVYPFEIEIWPTCNVFKKGHRIRLDISNGDSPAFDFGGHHFGLKVGKDTVYHEQEHASHLLLPIIEDGAGM